MLPRLPLRIVGTDRRDGNRLLVEFSDHSTSTYTIEQLIALEPASIEAFEVPPDKPLGSETPSDAPE
jgi:hypothetical protein